MRSIVLYLCFTELIKLIEAYLMACLSQRNTIFDNSLVRDRHLWTVRTNSVRRCAVECLQDERCVAFFYSTNGDCRAHSVVISAMMNTVKSPGWKYYVNCRGI